MSRPAALWARRFLQASQGTFSRPSSTEPTAGDHCRTAAMWSSMRSSCPLRTTAALSGCRSTQLGTPTGRSVMHYEGSREQIDMRPSSDRHPQIRAEGHSDKYLAPPHTAEFGVMFPCALRAAHRSWPNRNMVEILQRDYHVNLAGASCVSTLLNNTRCRSAHVAIPEALGWSGAFWVPVKTEFDG